MAAETSPITMDPMKLMMMKFFKETQVVIYLEPNLNGIFSKVANALGNLRKVKLNMTNLNYS